MKSHFHAAAGVVLAAIATVVSAQAAPQTTPPALSHDEAVEAATYLARQKAFAAECPFSERAKVALNRLDTVMRPALRLAPDELAALEAKTGAASRELVEAPNVKRMACPILEAALLRQATGEPSPLPPAK